MGRKRQSLLCVLSITFALAGLFASKTALALEFEAKSEVHAQNGQLHISWIDGEPPFTLKKLLSDSNSVIVYEGVENAYFLSGLNEEDFRLQVSDSLGESDTVNVSVSYPEVGQVNFYLVLGAVVFFILLFTVVRGHISFGRHTP